MATAILTFVYCDRLHVTFNYDGKGWNQPTLNDETRYSDWTNYEGSNLKQMRYVTKIHPTIGNTKWLWDFKGGDGGSSTRKTGQITISGFESGARQRIDGTLSGTATITTTTTRYKQFRTRRNIASDWVVGPLEQYKQEVTTEAYDYGSASNFFYFFTHPASFNWPKAPNEREPVSESITAKAWNILVDSAVAKHNWKYCQPEQPDHNKSWISLDSLHRNPRDPITADVCNLLARKLDLSEKEFLVRPKTTIFPAYFITLATKLNDWEKADT